MTARRAIIALACLVTAGLVALGVAELPHNSTGGRDATRLSAAQTKALLAGSPPALAALHSQGSTLLEGGSHALQARLDALKGYPIVINKWASWCGPCKEEFGAFQHASGEYGRRVAFIGIDSGESSRADALAFLKSFPVSYPSYYDPSSQLGVQTTDSSFVPVTVFIAPDGHRFIYQGQFPTVQKLDLDIRHYALQS